MAKKVLIRMVVVVMGALHACLWFRGHHKLCLVIDLLTSLLIDSRRFSCRSRKSP